MPDAKVKRLQNKILIVGPSWVGDMVMAQTLFIILKQQNSEVQIDVLAPAWTRPLLNRMPEVNLAIDMPIGHGKLDIKGRWKLAMELRRTEYDQAIVLPNSFKSALIPIFAKIPLRTGWIGEARSWLLNDNRKLDKIKYPLMQQRFAALGFVKNDALPEKLKYPRLVSDLNALNDLTKKYSLDDQRPALVLCPGAEFGAAKKWPETHFAEVALDSIKRGKQVWILGSENDKKPGDTIQKTIPLEFKKHCYNLAGKTRLGEAIDIISMAQVVISNDSGLMHIAAALSKPLVVVYGSTSPEFTPPLAKHVKILSLSLSCQPCFKRDCPLEHLQCLQGLKPEQVITAVEEICQ